MVGLPGVGKTTDARRLAAAERALRLTPDEWMVPLFDDNDANGKRDVLEGRFLWVAHQVLACGTSVVLDFGCWSAQERHAVRAVTELAGATYRLRYLTLPEDERRARCAARWRAAPHAEFDMTEEDQDRYVAAFEPPTPDELVGAALPPPPDGFASWPVWAAVRWPSFPPDPGQPAP